MIKTTTKGLYTALYFCSGMLFALLFVYATFEMATESKISTYCVERGYLQQIDLGKGHFVCQTVENGSVENYYFTRTGEYRELIMVGFRDKQVIS